MTCAMLMTLAVAQAAAQGLDQKVEYRTDGARVPVVLEDLEKKYGVALESDQDLRNTPIVVRVDDVTLKDLLDRIAKVTSSKWSVSTNGYELKPDADLREDEERAHRALLIKGVEAGLKEMTKQYSYLNQTPPKEGETAEPDFAFPQDGSSIIYNLTKAIPAELYASMRKGQRIVYSTTPTRMQRALNLRAYQDDIQEWIKYNNQMVETMNRESEGQGMVDEFSQIMIQMGVDYMPKKIDTQPVHGLVTVTRPKASTDYRSISLSLYDAAGKRILHQEASFYLFPYGVPEMPEDVVVEGGPPPEKAAQAKYPIEPKDDVKVEKSELGKELRKFGTIFRNLTESGEAPAPDKELVEKLVHLDINDPISYTGGDLLAAAAKVRGEDLVACLPDDNARLDSVFYQFSDGDLENVTVRDVRLQYKDPAYKESHEGSWWTITSSDPYLMRDSRFDRIDLTALIIEGRKHLVVPLEVLTDYAKDHDDLGGTFQMGTYMMFVCPTLMPIELLGGGSKWEALQLYGRLSAAQKQMLRNGEPIKVSSLSKSAKETVERLIYDEPGILEKLTEENLAQDEFLQMMSMSFMQGGSASSLDTEPTEAAPNGVNGGIVQMRVTSEPYLVELDEAINPNILGMTMGSSELALMKLMMKQPEIAAEAVNFKMDHMRLGYRTKMQGAVFVRPGLGARLSLTDHGQPDMNKQYSLNGLPPELESLVAERMKALEQSPFYKMISSGFAGGAGQDPPSN